jgi:quinol-cytochrome oxidoreductase complex cytochrome b subunit
MRGIVNNPVTSVIYHSFYNYPAPINFTYFWNFGVYAFVCLFIQIISGIVLAMHYIPDVTLAFFSIEHIMRDVNYGWLIRYVHANGASMFFIVVYIHIFRGLFFGSFIHPRELLWIVGVFILLLMIITAFLGYVLPWGQMSFWGVTVIINFFSVIPKIGNSLVIWLWGGYSVGGPTLQRFFSFHFFLPFIILVFSIVHIVFLHQFGSNNPLGLSFQRFDYLMFYPYYIIKDLFGLILFFYFFCVYSFFLSKYLGSSG